MELGSWTTIKKQMIARQIDCPALQHISPNCIPNRSLVENVIYCILNNSNHFLDPDNVENPLPDHPTGFYGDVCFSPMTTHSPVGIGLHFQEFTPSVFVKHGVYMQNGLQFDQDADFPDVRQQCLRALALLKYCKTANLFGNDYSQQVTRGSYLSTVSRTATGTYGEDETESFSSVVSRCRNGKVPTEDDVAFVAGVTYPGRIHEYDPEYSAESIWKGISPLTSTSIGIASHIEAVPLLNYYDWWDDGTPYCEPTGTYVCSDRSTRSDIATLPLIPEASRIENLLMYHASLYCYSDSDGGFSYVSSSEFSAPDGIENTTEGDYITWSSMRDPSTSPLSGGYHKDGLTVGVKSLNLGTWNNRVLHFLGTLPGDLPSPPRPSVSISHHTYPSSGCYYAARSILGYMLLGTIVHKYTFDS